MHGIAYRRYFTYPGGIPGVSGIGNGHAEVVPIVFPHFLVRQWVGDIVCDTPGKGGDASRPSPDGEIATPSMD